MARTSTAKFDAKTFRERLRSSVKRALDALDEALDDGSIKGRDIPITVGILCDKARQLGVFEPTTDELAELQARAVERRAQIEAEIERRRADLAAAAATFDVLDRALDEDDPLH